jgi:hypothetical protein
MGTQAQEAITAIVSHAFTENCRGDMAVTQSKQRRDQPGWDRSMAIGATATDVSIEGRQRLFLGQLVLHAPNYDALRRKDLLLTVHAKPSKVEPGTVITRSTGSSEHERLGFSNSATRHVCCILHGSIRNCVDDIQNPPP